MKRAFIVSFVVSLIAIASSACDSGDDDWGYASGYRGRSFCGQYDSCGACTPVLGCGWCFEAQGTGRCVDGPDECAGSSFGFTWEPLGCPYVADAGVHDGGAKGDAGDAGPVANDASAADVAVPDDAALPGDDASDEAAAPR